MADTPQPDPPGENPLTADGLPPCVPAVRPLVERAEVVWLLTWVTLALILLASLSTLGRRSAATGDAGEPPQFLTDINSAPAAELALLPGVGPQLAERIIAERSASGPFTSADQLARVRGIGPKTIEQVTPLVICGPLSAEPALPAVADLAAQPAAASQPTAAGGSPQALTGPARPAPARVQNRSPATTGVE